MDDGPGRLLNKINVDEFEVLIPLLMDDGPGPLPHPVRGQPKARVLIPLLMDDGPGLYLSE